MHFPVLFAAWFFTSSVVYLLLRSLVRRFSHARRARQLGCMPAPHLADNGIAGIKLTLRALEADKQNKFPVWVEENGHRVSKQEGRVVTTYRINALGDEQISTIDPKNIQAILATQFKDFGLGEGRITNFSPLLGHGIFSSDGKAWEHSRALLRPQFSRDQISDLDLEERHIQNMMRVMPVINSEGWTDLIDVKTLFFRLTLDSATEFLFGESVDSQIAHLISREGLDISTRPDERLFTQNFDRAQALLSMRARFNDLYWLANPLEFKATCRQAHDFIDYYVRLALKGPIPQSGSEKESAKKDKYIFLNALAAMTRDPTELRFQLLSILLAGRDTTASLLSWLFQLLAQHPQVFHKLRATVIDTFGTYENPRNLTFSDLKSCSYLQYCLNETLRLFPVVPVNSRRCLVENTTLPRGGGPDGNSPVYVRKGQEVGYCVYAMHRLEQLWGPDANEFRPDRWYGRKAGWEYLPFNGGPRICIGQQFALTEASYVTVRLVQRFEEVVGVGLPPFGQEKHCLTLTDSPAGGVKLRLREART